MAAAWARASRSHLTCLTTPLIGRQWRHALAAAQEIQLRLITNSIEVHKRLSVNTLRFPCAVLE